MASRRIRCSGLSLTIIILNFRETYRDSLNSFLITPGISCYRSTFELLAAKIRSVAWLADKTEDNSARRVSIRPLIEAAEKRSWLSSIFRDENLVGEKGTVCQRLTSDLLPTPPTIYKEEEDLQSTGPSLRLRKRDTESKLSPYQEASYGQRLEPAAEEREPLPV